ncbi:excinuclease ABC subunit B, partial [Mycoplasmopsis pullorum]
AYNQKHNIIPQTIIKPIPEPIHGDDLENQVEKILTNEVNTKTKKGKESKEELIQKLREQMNQAAKELDYERAIELRDIILELQSKK